MERKQYCYHLTKEVKKKQVLFLVVHMTFIYMEALGAIVGFVYFVAGMIGIIGPMLFRLVAAGLFLLGLIGVIWGVKKYRHVLKFCKSFADDVRTMICELGENAISFYSSTHPEPPTRVYYLDIVRTVFWKQNIYIVTERGQKSRAVTTVYIIPAEAFGDHADYREAKRLIKRSIKSHQEPSDNYFVRMFHIFLEAVFISIVVVVAVMIISQIKSLPLA